MQQQTLSTVERATPDGTAPLRTFVMVLYPQPLEEDVVEMLDSLGVPGYTEFNKVTGRGPRGRHFDAAIWPGAEGVIFTVVEPAVAEALQAGLARMSQGLESNSRGLYGLHAFAWTCQTLI